MIPRLNIEFPLKRQWQYWFGKQYEPQQGEYLLNHARTGIVMALRVALPNGGRVGVVAYNCHTVANTVANAGCVPFFVDVTEDLRIDLESVPVDLDAIVVTNLFGIRNDIASIRKRLPKAIIIVDNAHGYGLPAEGDFTVYSINQGKFPALGCGGILVVNLKENEEENIQNIEKKQENILEETKNIIAAIEEQYAELPSYSKLGEIKLFCSMLVKAIAYSRCVYWLTMKMKKSANPDVHESVSMKRMASGVRRLYHAWLPYAESEIAKQKRYAVLMSERLKDLKIESIIGENAFMLIAKTQDPAALQTWFASRGIETATHFARAIDWAKQFGYVEGSCPNAEYLVNHLLMVPTYSN